MKRPNILWICTDQQRYDTIGALGNSHIHTPHLNRLCAEGVAFTRTYSQSPVCTSSRASFLTGLYPSTIHVNMNGNEYFPKNVPLITRKLADTGYDCGLVGKLHIAGACKGEENRTDDGYRVFNYSHAPYTPYIEGNQYNQWLLEKGVNLDDIFEKNTRGVYYGYVPDIPVELHQTAWCAEKAIEFIREEGKSPWLLSVNIFDPHVPFDAPEAYQERYNPKELPRPLWGEGDLELQEKLKDVYHQTRIPRKPDRESQEIIASYYGMVELIDEHVGRIVDCLEKTGQRENTLIIFTSDHGEMLGDHGLTRKGCRFYEGAVRVPLIISWKGQFREGVMCDELVELTDIAPTLAELGEVVLAKRHGKSLLPLLRPGSLSEKHRDFVRCEDYNSLNSFAISNSPDEIKPYYATMYCDGKYKLTVYHGLKIGELYDLETDPNEFTNLWDDPQVREVKYDLMKKSFDASMVITDPGPPLIGSY